MKQCLILGFIIAATKEKTLDYAILAMDASMHSSKPGQFVTSVFSFSVSELCLSVLVRRGKGKRETTEELILLINAGGRNGKRM